MFLHVYVPHFYGGADGIGTLWLGIHKSFPQENVSFWPSIEQSIQF